MAQSAPECPFKGDELSSNNEGLWSPATPWDAAGEGTLVAVVVDCCGGCVEWDATTSGSI